MRVTLNKSELPPVSEDGTYTVRVRVVSDSKNASSFWSPAFKVALIEGLNGYVNAVLTANVYQKRVGASSPTPSDVAVHTITVTWVDDNALPSYDVYVKWYTQADGWSDYAYLTSVYDGTYTFASPQPAPFVPDPAMTPEEQDAAEAIWLAEWPTKLVERVGVAVTRSTYQHNYLPSMALFSTDNMPLGGVVLG